MEVDYARIKIATEFSKQCLLPELNCEIGNQQIEREDFTVFVFGLEKNLGLLFDIVSKNEETLFKEISETVAFRTHFILLLNEQLAGQKAVPFQTLDRSLQSHLYTLFKKYFQKTLADKKVAKAVMDFYKSTLTTEAWKKNLGAVYGFNRFCELYYRQAKIKIANSEGMFLLSVGTILTDHFDHIFKDIGLNLFLSLLCFGNKTFLADTNIHELIYTKIKDSLIITIKDENTATVMYLCLLKCIEYKQPWKNSLHWNVVDDVIEVVINRIILDDNLKFVSLYFLSKLMILPTLQAEQNANVIPNIEGNNSKETTFDFGVADLAEKGSDLKSNPASYRWAKKILDLLSQQRYFGTTNQIRLHLNAARVCYVCCISHVPIRILDCLLIDSIKKVVPALIDVYKTNKTETKVLHEINKYIGALLVHIKDNNCSLGEHRNVFENVSHSLEEVLAVMNETGTETEIIDSFGEKLADIHIN